MKNIICAGALLLTCLVLVMPAQATLETDEVTGSATGLTMFGPPTAPVVFDFDPEFTGTLDIGGADPINFDLYFNINDDFLDIFIEHDQSGSLRIIPDFTVTFSDLDYVGFPTFVLTDVTSEYDTHGAGQGLTVSFTDDSVQLSFVGFEVPESRQLGLNLIFEEEEPTTPVPEPTSLTLLMLGAVGLALKRKFS